MRIRQRFALIALAIFGFQPASAQLVCKAAEGYTKALERLPDEGVPFQNSLAAKARANPDVAKAARFQDPDLPPQVVAIKNSSLGFGRAEAVAPNKLGNNTATEWVELTNLKRVIDADGISFDKMGNGLGSMATGLKISDFDLGKILEGQRKIFDRRNEFTDVGFTEAHFLRDMEIIFGKDGLGGPANGNFKSLIAGLKGSDGSALEMRVAASRKDSLEGLQVDKDYFGGDVLTKTEVLKVALSGGTVANKISGQKNSIALAVIKAAMESPPRRYKFVIAKGNWGDVSKLNTQIGNLNKKIEEVLDELQLPVNPQIPPYTRVGDVLEEVLK